MKLIIDIPEDDYELVKKYIFPQRVLYEIVHGTPLNEQEPKTGHWNTYVVSNRGIDEEWLECSECKWSNALLIPRNYCPKCGCRMSEGSE